MNTKTERLAKLVRECAENMIESGDKGVMTTFIVALLGARCRGEPLGGMTHAADTLASHYADHLSDVETLVRECAENMIESGDTDSMTTFIVALLGDDAETLLAPPQPKHLKRWTVPDSYFGETWPGYYRAGFGQSRDSDALEESNFATALARLGGESETVLVVREGHWAIGWVEWIAIHESDATALGIADELLEQVESYPILDEDDFSDRETAQADTIWRDCYSVADRIAYIRDNRSQFDFVDFQDLLCCVRGQYFAGYVSDLLY